MDWFGDPDSRLIAKLCFAVASDLLVDRISFKSVLVNYSPS
jgi:hypothetical protein